VLSGVAYADPPTIPTTWGATKSDTKDITGASATCTVSATLSGLACSIRDTAVDKKSVFVEWYDSAGRKYRVHNTDGANHEKSFVNDSLWKGVDNSRLKWHVCVKVRGDNDRCSKYQTYAVGPNGLSLDVYCQVSDSASLAATCSQLRNQGLDDGWELSRDCLIGAGLQAAGIYKDGKGSVDRGNLKLRGGGWYLTIAGVVVSISQCR